MSTFRIDDYLLGGDIIMVDRVKQIVKYENGTEANVSDIWQDIFKQGYYIVIAIETGETRDGCCTKVETKDAIYQIINANGKTFDAEFVKWLDDDMKGENKEPR